MLNRLLLALTLALAPFTAYAGSTTATPTGLGPDATSVSSGGSNADAGALQPAGTSPLQSTSASSAGLTAPSNVLQGSAPSGEALKVLEGEADGPPQSLDEDSSNSGYWLVLNLLLAFAALAAVIVVIRDRRRFRNTAP